MDDEFEPYGRVAIAVGTIGSLIVAGLLADARGSAGSANVALVLACLVVAAALAGRLAGAATAVTAAIAYDYFHTLPYYSLRIDTGRDVTTVGLLLVIGLVVSEASARRRRALAAARHREDIAARLEHAAALVARGVTTEELWPEIRSAIVDAMRLEECSFVEGATAAPPEIPRSGVLTGRRMQFRDGGFALPRSGASIVVAFDGRTLGRLVLIPSTGSTSTLDSRRAAVALADLFAVALGRDSARVQS